MMLAVVMLATERRVDRSSGISRLMIEYARLLVAQMMLKHRRRDVEHMLVKLLARMLSRA